MLIKKENARKKENSPGCIVREYDFPHKELGLANAHITGRFPETGKAINNECNEIYYIISGTWTIHHESWTYPITAWDCFFFEKSKRYRVEGDNLHILLSTAPARFLQQYNQIT